MTANIKLPRKLSEEETSSKIWTAGPTVRGFGRQNHPKTRRPDRLEAGRNQRHRGEAPRRTRRPNAG